MKTAPNNKAFAVLFLSILLMLLFLIADVLYPEKFFASYFVHLTTVISLCVAFAMAIMVVRSRQKLQCFGHSKEMEGMQREVDKTVRRYTSLLEGAGNAIFVFNAETGVLEEVNRKGIELLGFSKEEMLALRGKELFLAAERKKFVSLVYRVKRRGRGHADSLAFLRKDGVILRGEVEARLIDLGDEKLVHAIVRDITFKHHYLREIRRRNLELSVLNSILSNTGSTSTPTDVLAVALKGTLDRFGSDAGIIHLLEEDGSSLKLSAFLNISDTLKGSLTHCSLHGEGNCQLVASQRCHVLKDAGTALCHIAKLAATDGWECISAAPLIAKGRFIGIMHIFDRMEHQYTNEELLFLATIGNQTALVVEQSRLFQELNQKNEELLRSHNLLEQSSHRLSISQGLLRRNLALVEQANQEMLQLDRMKSHFLGMVSHEFNTPLTSILGGAELLINNFGSLDKEEESQIHEMIRSGGARLSEIVTDLLKAAKLEAKTDALNKTPLQLASVLEFLHTQLTPLLKERKQTVLFADLEQLPYFNGDRLYLEEVMSELLMNAMKFMPDGGEIVVSGRVVSLGELQLKEHTLRRFNVSFYEKIASNCYLEIEVRDKGIGIEATEQLRIFEMFYEIGEIRHHSSSKHKFQGKGAGLGLSIVKGMVEAHGGMVWVESPAVGRESEEGASFFLLLPLEERVNQPEFQFMREQAV